MYFPDFSSFYLFRGIDVDGSPLVRIATVHQHHTAYTEYSDLVSYFRDVVTALL